MHSVVRYRDEGDYIKVFIPVPEGAGVYCERQDAFVEIGRVDYHREQNVYTQLARFTVDPAKSILLVTVRG